MQFNSVQFLVFLPVVVLGYFAVPDKYKNKWLLLRSYYFYMCWNAVYALLIFFSTFSTWVCAGFVSKKELGQGTRKAALALSVVINLAILFVFKYYGMFAGLITDVFALAGISVVIPKLSLLLPVGISFYTFQALGYAVDVYRGNVQHEKNFLNYALFVSFFPQLVAGPIERSSNLLPQFHKYNKFSYENYSIGMRLMLIGFFKKIVIADNLSLAVDRYYEYLEIWPGPLLIAGIVLFAIQVYCDFSAYSDIARGRAKVLGFDLMLNFDHPYFSKSVAEFWRRWHISLNSWFTDYIYIPLGGSRCGLARTCINILIVYMVSGLWHGASLTFVVWGLLNGFYNVLGRIIRTNSKKEKKETAFSYFIKIIRTFVLICFSWIFFRSQTFGQAWYIISHSIHGWGALMSPAGFLNATISLFGSAKTMFASIFAIIVLLVIEIAEEKNKEFFPALVQRFSPAVRWAIYYGLLFSIALLGCFEQSSFIYFQF